MTILTLITADTLLPKLSLNLVSASLDSRITFSRSAATATRINASGYIETVAEDVARFDFDPVSLLCKGLLVEETRKNILLHSEDVSQAAWGTKTNINQSTGAGTAPTNTSVANRIYENSSTGVHEIGQQITLGNAAYSFSVFLKKDQRDRCIISMTDNSTGAANGLVDLSAGTIVAGPLSVGSWTSTSYSIADFGNGWYRATVTATKAAGTVVTFRVRLVQSGTTNNYAGDGASGIYMWGAQAEAGAFRTSYIPTDGTAGGITRNADVVTMTGTNFSSWWQAVTGAAVVRWRPSTVSGTRPILQFDDTTADNIIALRGNTTNPELYIKATTDQAQIDAGTIAANTDYRIAGMWNTNECAASINAGTPVLDGVATIPTVTQARLGSDGTNYLNGHIQSIEYWPERLVSGDLQILSSVAGYNSIITPVLGTVI